MSVIILLIIFSLIVAIIFLVLFIWSVKSGQYDDTHSPSVRILFDDKRQKKAKKNTTEAENRDNPEDKTEEN